MLKKTRVGLVMLGVISVLVSSASIYAAKNVDDYVLPENEGVYDVPGKDHMKLKVIVYHAKDNPEATKGGKTPPVAPEYKCVSSTDFDKDSLSEVSAAGWKLPSTWNYNVNLSSVPSTIGAEKADAMIRRAYGTWQTQLGGAVNFIQGANTRANAAKYDGQNIVTWGRASSTTLAVTYIWYDTVTGATYEIDTIMNNRFTWYWSDQSQWPEGSICAYQGVYDAQGILTHELGHTIGLDDHYTSDYVDNTMYGYGLTGDAKETTLTTGDILGAQRLYGLLAQ